ncbi:Mur ligase family protein [Dethiobacter alkaliphilus]|uniref:Mur ligase middle domain protein n=1 Tax=Dethiobacter alkaliphilus AHT 1 TaxID=555088 RepID=C0GCD6_DETAL|nr:Mur ligase family protein [Dethiobacter alkaliphilus]EEG78871.1 Mur ligase middle domain protein [Dethiobacter alkaliphilus AHT 1]
MKALPLKEILAVIDGEVIAGSSEFEIIDVKTSSPGLRNGTLFFHTKKGLTIDQNFNRYKKRVAIVTDKKIDLDQLNDNVTLITVDNSVNALASFTSYYRGLFTIPVVGITGTAGKTTTKEMLAHILRGEQNVQCTYKSMNGIVLNLKYLLGINEDTDVAVFEMGVSYPGNIRKSGAVFKPSIGMITNIGTAHLETCKTLERYIGAKGEMLEALDYKGQLLLNSDDENIKKIDLHPFKGQVYYFGQKSECAYRISQIEYAAEKMVFQLHVKGHSSKRVYVPGLGEQCVYNAAAAIAAAHLTGMDLSSCIERIGSFKQMERHVSVERGLNRATIIDDTWNSNPSSAYAALKVLQKIAENKKSVAVFGKLQRLGAKQHEEHVKLGARMKELGISCLITIGKDAQDIGDAAIQAGIAQANVFNVLSAEELQEKLLSITDENTVVLLKMSLDKMDQSYRRQIMTIKSTEN